MPPRKRKAEEVAAAAAPRRSPRLANKAPEFPLQELPLRKKRKTDAERKPEKKDAAGTSKEEAKDGDAEEENQAAGDENARTFVIEHCKTGGLFKGRANEAKAGLELAIPGVNVLLNPAEPRKGCFEIGEQDGEIFISLLDMKRPYKALKDLDMEEVIANIMEKINASG